MMNMKLVEIKGRLWELSCLQSSYSVNGRNISDEEANNKVLVGRDISDVTRVLSGYGVRSKATALVEISVHNLPHQNQYEIYLSSKGFYSNIQGKRVYLLDLLAKPTHKKGNSK